MKTSLNEYRCKTTNIFITRTDTRAEIDLVCELAKRAGAFNAVPCYHWSIGGKGSVDLAWAVREAASKESRFQFLYDVQVRSSTMMMICQASAKSFTQVVMTALQIRINKRLKRLNHL